jgi:hypothetical protein
MNTKHLLNIIKKGLGELTLDEAIESTDWLEKWAEGSLIQPKDKIMVYLMEVVPHGLGSIKLLDYNNTDLTVLLTGAAIINDISNITSDSPLTIVNLLGMNITNIQQTMKQAEDKLLGRDVSHIVISATPEEHSRLLNQAKSPRRKVRGF